MVRFPANGQYFEIPGSVSIGTANNLDGIPNGSSVKHTFTTNTTGKIVFSYPTSLTTYTTVETVDVSSGKDVTFTITSSTPVTHD